MKSLWGYIFCIFYIWSIDSLYASNYDIAMITGQEGPSMTLAFDTALNKLEKYFFDLGVSVTKLRTIDETDFQEIVWPNYLKKLEQEGRKSLMVVFGGHGAPFRITIGGIETITIPNTDVTYTQLKEFTAMEFYEKYLRIVIDSPTSSFKDNKLIIYTLSCGTACSVRNNFHKQVAEIIHKQSINVKSEKLEVSLIGHERITNNLDTFSLAMKYEELEKLNPRIANVRAVIYKKLIKMKSTVYPIIPFLADRIIPHNSENPSGRHIQLFESIVNFFTNTVFNLSFIHSTYIADHPWIPVEIAFPLILSTFSEIFRRITLSPFSNRDISFDIVTVSNISTVLTLNDESGNYVEESTTMGQSFSLWLLDLKKNLCNSSLKTF